MTAGEIREAYEPHKVKHASVSFKGNCFRAPTHAVALDSNTTVPHHNLVPPLDLLQLYKIDSERCDVILNECF